MSEEEKVKNLVIKNGLMELIIPRNQVKGIEPTGDGIVFNFINGSHLYHTDMDMSSGIKQTIANANMTFKNVNLIINLKDYKQPVKVEV